MNGPFVSVMRDHLGFASDQGVFGLLYSVRLDETGVDGTSGHAVLAGAIGTPIQWGRFEEEWIRIKRYYRVAIFHAKEFNESSGEFEGWSLHKGAMFLRHAASAIDRSGLIKIATAVDIRKHKEFKVNLSGVKKVGLNSDIRICFRAIMLKAAELLHFDNNNVLLFIVEAGNSAAGDMASMFERLKRSEGVLYGAATHAPMLKSLTFLAKGELPSLDIADLLGDEAIKDIPCGRFDDQERRVGWMLDEECLQKWFDGIHQERDKRRLHAEQRFRTVQ